MTTPRDVLNRVKWTEGGSLPDVEVWYVHRGAPSDARVIKGSDISELGSSFFTTGDATIPYHRIFRITRGEEVLFERRSKA